MARCSSLVRNFSSKIGSETPATSWNCSANYWKGPFGSIEFHENGDCALASGMEDRMIPRTETNPIIAFFM
jgi:hypothetical protein